jgi:hypothetical protein
MPLRDRVNSLSEFAAAPIAAPVAAPNDLPGAAAGRSIG